MSNERVYDDPRVETIAVGQLQNWSMELRAVLARVTTSHILLILDDFFLRSRINQVALEQCFDAMLELEANMFRLVRRPAPSRRIPGETLFGEIEPGAPYRVSTQGALWRKAALEAVLLDGESIWQFECHGSRRSDTQSGYFAVWRDVLTYRHHVVERGRWFRDTARVFGGMAIGCDFERRQVMSHGEMLHWYCRKVLQFFVSLVPLHLRRATKRILIDRNRPSSL